MNDPHDELEDPGIDRVLELGMDMALRTQDPERLRTWLEHSLPILLEWEREDGADPGEAWRSAATELSRTIWNVTPLPEHDFRPRPLPRPGRNSLCPCGSGAKYKRCCGRKKPPPIELTQETGWLLALRCLSQKDIKAAIERQRVPIGVLAEHAHWLIENAEPDKVPSLLKPLFSGERLAGNADHERAFDVLLDAYDELGKWRAKMRLIDNVIANSPRSALRSGAWQRLATIRMDEGDGRGAWEAFQAASRDDPDSPALSYLEVHLLIAEGKSERARERARYWVRRLEKKRSKEYEGLIGLLRDITEDPTGTLADAYIGSSGGAGAALRKWLALVADRPVPRYELVAAEDLAGDEETEPSARVLDQLERMGISGLDRDDVRNQISLALEDADEVASSESEPPLDKAYTLRPPRGLARVEQAWRDVFALEKPFSTQPLPFHTGYHPWDAGSEDTWSYFLEKHPEAFDSLDILDDLATAVQVHEGGGAAPLDEVLLAPILERALAIVEMTVRGVSDVVLPWGFPENRPALRAIDRLIRVRRAAGDDVSAESLAERMLALNPNDNHGVRALLVSARLQHGRDDAVLELCDRFPGDMLADTAFGRVLALYRLGRVEEAGESLRDAVADHPPLVKVLTAKRARKLDPDPRGYVLGGEEEALEYREAMRDTWAETPGALEWLRRAARKVSRSH